MKLLCIKSVIMRDSEEQTFTEGKEYKGYKRTEEIVNNEGWPTGKLEKLLYAKNDQKHRHIIAKLDSGDLNEFFYTHFKIIL